PTRERCVGNRSGQKTVTRHVWQDYLERAEDVRHSPLGKETYALRSQTIERVFADAKEKYAMRYTPYRGLDQVSNWVRLKFAAMNLKKLAMWKFKASFSSLSSLQFFLFYIKNPVSLA
ncbi:transposase, partial [Desulforamulus ruminis]|uniref:transposase n=1 Tax=Desulforamulus ruminis TaxID=1564 RepID=UPI002FDB4A62